MAGTGKAPTGMVPGQSAVYFRFSQQHLITSGLSLRPQLPYQSFSGPQTAAERSDTPLGPTTQEGSGLGSDGRAAFAELGTAPIVPELPALDVIINYPVMLSKLHPIIVLSTQRRPSRRVLGGFGEGLSRLPRPEWPRAVTVT
eukprot:767389-Hanusia_phi.AAC.3